MRSIKDVMTSFVAMSIISVAACTEDHTVVNPSVPQVHSRNLVNTRSGQYSFRDSLWFSYVDDVPGFGGMYFDDGGDLIVFLTDTSAESRLRATKTLVGYVGQSHRPNTLPASGHPATMRFRHADRDYRQLFDIKERLLGKMAVNLPSLVSVGVDERENRVHIGVASQAGANAASLARQELGLSEDVLKTTVDGSANTVSDTVPYYSSFSPLTNPAEPLIGGMYIHTWSAGQNCTLGLMIDWHVGAGNYLPGFLTAEHCLWQGQDTVVVSSDSVWTNNPNLALDLIGDVAYDGNWVHSCTYQGSTHTNCMHADVAIINTANRADASIRKMYGIAQSPSMDIMGYGAGIYYLRVSTYDGTANGPFIVDSDISGGAEVVGQYVSKVGAVTGWTYGPISAISDRVRGKDFHIIRGTVEVRAGVAIGDSGSPVFYSETYVSGNPKVSFDGVVWGASGNSNGAGHFDHFLYSPIYKVRQQLGAYGYTFFTFAQP